MNAAKLQKIVDELSLDRAYGHERGPRGAERIATPPRIPPWQGGGWDGFLGPSNDAGHAAPTNGHANGHAYGANGFARSTPWQESASVGSGTPAFLGTSVLAAGVTTGLGDNEEVGWGALGMAALLASLWTMAKANKGKVALSALLWGLVIWVYWMG